jgi:hypothetical protein
VQVAFDAAARLVGGGDDPALVWAFAMAAAAS